MIDNKNTAQFKISSNQSEDKSFELEIRDMKPMDALLIIFEKRDN